MGGAPAAMGNAAASAGDAIGGAAKAFYGGAKGAVESNVIQPWRDAIGDMKGNPPDGSSAPTPGPGQQQAPGNPGQQPSSAMSNFFNAPAVETPAMRQRRMQAQQS